jgi:hypothetical protein
MARSVYALTICSAVLLAASQASALQLTNRDTADHKLVVTENGATQDIVIQPSQMLDSICVKGCTIKMSDGEEYEFDGTEVVSIEEGLMFLDEPGDTEPDLGNADSEAAGDIPEKKDQ